MIYLKAVRLVNWYGFNLITVPIGRFSLVAGQNGNGKSVLLDAIKYALYGDTVFNKSTENKGSRTLSSYTRGLLDATAGTYMRPADRHPNVTSHIVLEMWEEELNRTFVLGTVLETNASNGLNISRYIMENVHLGDIRHVAEEGGEEIPYGASQLQKLYGLKMLDAREGIGKFMQRTGLRLNEQQTIVFRRKLRSIMSYDPEAKIDQFIRESVLEERKVDFTKLVEAKNNIDTLNTTFTKIDEEVKELESILKLFEEQHNAANNIFADDVKLVYKRVLGLRQEIEEAAQKADMAQRQLNEDEKQLALIEQQETEIKDRLHQASENLESMDCTKAIQIAQNRVDELTRKRQELRKESQQLETFQVKVGELLQWFYEQNRTVEQIPVLSALTTGEHTAAQKANAAARFLEQIGRVRDEIFAQLTNLKKMTEDNQLAQQQQQKIIDDCNAMKATYGNIPDYVALKNEINKELTKRQLPGEAKFACEYVIALTDEKWRDAIEAFLGIKRYTILVDPAYYDIADDVLNESAHRYAHLFNTKLLMRKDIKQEEDSVARFLEIKNEVAKRYFAYQLGKMHAVSKSEVRHFENAISKEGRVSVAMDSFYLQFDKISFYCLGQEAISLNKTMAEKKLADLLVQGKALKEQTDEQRQYKEYLETAGKFFKEYSYDACQVYEELITQCDQAEKELQDLIKAQQDNAEYMELYHLMERCKKELTANKDLYAKVKQSRINMGVELDSNQKAVAEKSALLKYTEIELTDLQTQNIEISRKAMEAYDKFVANGRTGSGGTLKDRKRAENALKEAGENLAGAQSGYNAMRAPESRLPMGEGYQSAYEARRAQVWMDDFQEIQEKLKEQTRRYEEIFKKEFVLTVLKSCESAREDLKGMNRELARLKFRSKYEFEVKYVKDGSDYEKILEYARYLKEREELGTTAGQMTLSATTTFTDEQGEALEKDIRKIINRIIDSNDRYQIEHYADYRNYMTYEILLTNDILNKAKLSKQSGYNSGAEVQIPYMLILLSAILMVYNEKNNSTRLVFIDEPFAKMDPGNVKIMLKFMKDQKLQMVFVAPDKTELIGNACDVILPVLRTSPDFMEIGIVELR
jgi:energy-coupling factor transporter ATP-binding protein EcfA2